MNVSKYFKTLEKSQIFKNKKAPENEGGRVGSTAGSAAGSHLLSENRSLVDFLIFKEHHIAYGAHLLLKNLPMIDFQIANEHQKMRVVGSALPQDLPPDLIYYLKFDLVDFLIFNEHHIAYGAL